MVALSLSSPVLSKAKESSIQHHLRASPGHFIAAWTAPRYRCGASHLTARGRARVSFHDAGKTGPCHFRDSTGPQGDCLRGPVAGRGCWWPVSILCYAGSTRRASRLGGIGRGLDECSSDHSSGPQPGGLAHVILCCSPDAKPKRKTSYLFSIDKRTLELPTFLTHVNSLITMST